MWLIGLLMVGSAANRVVMERPDAGSTAAQTDALRGPSPELLPEDVVRIQLEALRFNDAPFANAGIETAYKFASAQNIAGTGSLSQFVEMVQNPLYRPLIGYRQVEYGPAETRGEAAHQVVVVTRADGARVGYLFSMSRQADGACAGCWMTDSVLRLDVEIRQERDGNLLKT